jgi:hypothetical protein
MPLDPKCPPDVPLFPIRAALVGLGLGPMRYVGRLAPWPWPGRAARSSKFFFLVFTDYSELSVSRLRRPFTQMPSTTSHVSLTWPSS